MSSATLLLTDFAAGAQLVILNEPIPLRAHREEGIWFVESEQLPLFGHGVSVGEAVSVIRHDLGYLWNRSRTLRDDELSARREG